MELTTEQQAAIREIDNNLQIIACAGSGKTEVITRRIAKILKQKPDIKPKDIVAFTFTEKAAESMKNRIKSVVAESTISDTLSDMYIGTIHGFCYHLLEKYSDDFKDFKILDTVKNYLFVSRYYNKCGMSDLGLDLYPNNIKLFLQCIDKMVDDYDNCEQWNQLHRDIFEKYRSCLYKRGYLDFSLLIFETIQQIKRDSGIADFISDIKYLVVDEYQDIDDLQEKLVHYFSIFGANICIVGDDDQTIYQFRGSNANNMITFAERYPNVTQVKLEKNFRCALRIVDIADSVIQNNQNRIAKKMISEATASNSSTTKAKRFGSSEEQYMEITMQIEAIHKQGTPYKEIAVLVRKGKFINPICVALAQQGVPYITDSADYFFNGDYFKRFVTTLQMFVNIDKAQLYQCWQGYIDNETFNAGFKYLRRAARSGGDGFALALSSVITEFLQLTHFLDQNAHDIQTRTDDLKGFISILDDYDEIYRDWQLNARITGLLRFLEAQAVEEYKYHSFKSKELSEDAVQIMTVHKAKGLEFHTVFLPNLMEGEFPMSNIGGKKYWHVLGGIFEDKKAKFMSDIDDERKLFYVAVTRAKQNLYLYYELSKKQLSTFVVEAATSTFLNINQTDLDVKVANSTKNAWDKKSERGAEMKAEWEKEQEERRETNELRHKLFDEIHAMVAAGMRTASLDYDAVKNADLEGLREIARHYGF